MCFAIVCDVYAEARWQLAQSNLNDGEERLGRKARLRREDDHDDKGAGMHWENGEGNTGEDRGVRGGGSERRRKWEGKGRDVMDSDGGWQRGTGEAKEKHSGVRQDDSGGGLGKGKVRVIAMRK